MNLRPLRPEGVLARVEQGWLSAEAVRIRPSLFAELGSRRYSVGYSIDDLNSGAVLVGSRGAESISEAAEMDSARPRREHEALSAVRVALTDIHGVGGHPPPLGSSAKSATSHDSLRSTTSPPATALRGCGPRPDRSIPPQPRWQPTLEPRSPRDRSHPRPPGTPRPRFT